MKNFLSQSAALALAVGLLAGCATNKPAPAPAATAPSAAQAQAATQAISEAQAVISGAQSPCTDTGNAADLLNQAQAAQATDAAKSQSLAGQAKQTATDSINNCYVGKAKDLQAQAGGYTNLNADQQARLNQCAQDISSNNGKAAYDLCAALVAELQAAKMTYAVVKGDSLWRIAGKSDVYGNAYEWPLIYKANTDKIKHADLIYPKQQFDVMKNPLKTDADSAADYAKHRGAWRGHKADKKDKKYASGGK
ncbi:MAG: LysM peptidoglycan-binding domain-containing protein [Bacillota bacterium]